LFSSVPSIVPSIVPTVDQSFKPSISVTSAPVIAGTMRPSYLSSAPNAQDIPAFEFKKAILPANGVTMVLGRSKALSEQFLALDSNCTQIWQNSIKERIEGEIVTIIPQYETVDVELFDVRKSSNISAFSLRFDIVVEIRSAIQDVDVNRFIKGPFDSQNDKSTYQLF
jgi:hypothetical protein